MKDINSKSLKIKAEKEIKEAGDLKRLDNVFKKYLGRKGEITQILRSLKDLPEKERKKTGKSANQIKQEIEKSIRVKKKKFQSSIRRPASKGVDVTIPGKKPSLGSLHPITLVKRRVEEIFQNLGFSVVEGPEIEN